jgi:thiol-disulfide isomerase/thioredoxin
VVFAAALGLVLAQAAAEPSLRIGDPAPPLAVEKWLRGAPVTRFERGTVYVLDFWAVWCPPCISAMSHTSELADRFRGRGVRVIALTGPDDAGNTLPAVERALSRHASRMRFDVAWDGPTAPGTPPYADMLRGRTVVRYFAGAQLDGMPSAVIVDQEGRLAWLGGPTALAAPLEAIVERHWDVRAAAARDRTRRTAEPQIQEFRELLEAERYDEGYALARRLADGPFAHEPGYLRLIAAAIVGRNTVWKRRDVDLALDAAERAAALTDLADDTVLSALARAHFVNGDVDAAVAAQELALALTDPPMPVHQAALETYRAARRP